jgi:sialate O-acetylesterase
MGGHCLYGAMLQRIEKAGGRLRGILWYQGESDAFMMDLARTYAQRFDEWIAAVRADTGIPDLPVIAVQIGRVVEPDDRTGVWPGWDMVREALRTLPQRVPHTAVTSAVDLPLVDIIHIDTPGLIRLGKRLARLALKLTAGANVSAGPEVASIERFSSPAGICNAVRVRFRGLTGRWACNGMLRGFEVHLPDADRCAPLYAVNAWVDRESGDGTDVIVLLNREMDAEVMLGYGVGLNPACDLADEADMPLCAFVPQPVI